MSSLKILVCEDEQLAALDLSQRLERMGHVVVGTAGSGIEAVSMARELHPDLALMDVKLSGSLPGTAVADTLGRQLHIPSIFISGATDPDTVRCAQRAHPLAYLVKPVSDQDLQMAIEFGMAHHQIEETLREELDAYSALLTRIESAENGDNGRVRAIPEAEAQPPTRGLEQVGGLVASVAHHLNNSLAVVLGSLEWLAASATLEAHEQRAIRSALEGCYQQKLFIQKLLWASQQGPRDISIERVDEILRQVITHIERLKRPNVTIVVKKIREELAVCADQAALTNSLLGVMLYAQGLLDGQGTITVAAESEHISPGNLENRRAVAGSFVVISIHSTGRALNSAELQEAFRPAYIEDGDVNAVSLALPVAHGVAQGHSGWISVESQAGAGTEIKLFLPRVFPQ